jgi:16S rRNA G1207 methylase RsmC
MALEFDGFDAWRAIAESPETFASLRAEAAKSARTALTKFAKAKATGLAELRRARKAVGKDQFRLLVDGMKDAEVKALVARLDRHHPEQKGAEPAWRRQHFLLLVKGDVEPTEKPKKPVKKPKAAARPKEASKPKEAPEGGDWFASAGAVRKREGKPD